MNSAEVSSFCSQVELLLEAGLPLDMGMETLAQSAQGTEYAGLYDSVSKKVTETGSLHEALKEDERWPAYLTEMSGIGERTGKLEQVMKSLASYYDRENRIHSSIVSAVTYPLFLSVMLVVIVLIMVTRVLPVFRRVINSFGADISAGGRMLIQVGSTIGWIVLIVVAVLILLILIGVIMMRLGAREKVLSIIRKLFPPVGRIEKKINASRVASVFSMMLSSGFTTEEAFRTMPSVLSDQETIEKVGQIRKDLEEGKAFADAMSASGLFEGLHDRMIRMGAAAGREEQVMDKLSGIYEEQVEDGIAHLISIIEPSLIALLAVVIGAILLSVMLPMVGILSGMM